MVLSGDEGQITLGGEVFGPGCGEVAGMQIVNNGLRLDLEGACKMGEALLKA